MTEVAARAARLESAGAATLGLSVLADSAVEHYRGSFRNPAMALPLIASAVTIAVNTRSDVGGGWRRLAVHGGSAGVGALGLGFHAWNIAKRAGGPRLTHFFYGAPIGAPAALILSSALGLAGDRLRVGRTLVPGGRPGDGPALGLLVAGGLLGTVGEAGLLHFRGAFHNPAMLAPVTLPPLAALALAADALRGRPGGASRGLLAATAALGLAGVAFHAWGVHRNMGGWRNWRQTLLAGPPLPAPPAFTGLAVAGLGALALMEDGT